MASHVVVDLDENPSGSDPSSAETGPPKRRRRKVVLIVLAGLAVLLVAAGLWFFLGRDQARQLGTDEALSEFRSANSSSGTADGLPVAGVYPATATGVESIGIPGFDENLGPNAPVTVTHGAEGCFTYRSDFNSHHWRSWTFCPTATATFALRSSEGWTERKAPGLDIATLATFDCEQPVDFLWTEATVGETRSGQCTGTNDIDDAVTGDAVTVEVLGTDRLTVGDQQVDVVHVRSTETFSQAQTGTEVDEWWLEADTGLPVRLVIDARLQGGLSSYTETADLQLTSMTPAT
jgi:hypothetical protein